MHCLNMSADESFSNVSHSLLCNTAILAVGFQPWDASLKPGGLRFAIMALSTVPTCSLPGKTGCICKFLVEIQPCRLFVWDGHCFFIFFIFPFIPLWAPIWYKTAHLRRIFCKIDQTID